MHKSRVVFEVNTCTHTYTHQWHISQRHTLRAAKLPGSSKRKTLLLKRAAVKRCMGCHGPQASLVFTVPAVHHDKHLPDQLGSTTTTTAASASTPPQWVSSHVHPGPTAITNPEQVHAPVFGWLGSTAFTSVHRRIHLSVLQNGEIFSLCNWDDNQLLCFKNRNRIILSVTYCKHGKSWNWSKCSHLIIWLRNCQIKLDLFQKTSAFKMSEGKNY